jgi:multidrug efflux pump subunit AcrA (membrane-fusion protein)
MSDYQQTVAEGVVAGAVIGGIIGAVSGGGDTRRMMQNITTGAVAGGIVGGGVGLMIAGRKQEFAQREAALDALVTDAQDRNARLTKLVRATQSLIAQRRSELERVKALQVGSAQRASARRQLLAELEADQAALAEAITMVEKSHRELAENIAHLRQRYPEGLPPAVASLFNQHGKEKDGLTPDQLNKILRDTQTAVS